jgi:hypothetical protein
MADLAEPHSKLDLPSTIRGTGSEPITWDASDAALHKVAMDRGLRQFLDRCEHGDAADKTAEMLDHIIGEIDRNVAFPPCRVCGVAMGLFLATPSDGNSQERIFKCPTCGMIETKLVETE